MTRIAVFVSGSGDSSLRITKLFNEGNRISVVIAFAEEDSLESLEKLKELGVETSVIPPSFSPEQTEEMINLLKARDINIIVTDGYDKPLPKELEDIYSDRIVPVTSPEEGPREIVAAINRINNSDAEEKKAEESDAPKSMDEEWAETLKINFDPSMTTPPPVDASTPPPLPQDEPPVEDNSERMRPHNHGYNPQDNFYYGNENTRRESYRYRQEQQGEPMPSTYLIWSVLITIFCCFIPGIVAIVFSSQVSSRYYAGDYEGARRASRNAEIWIIVSFVLGVLAATLYLPIAIIGS